MKYILYSFLLLTVSCAPFIKTLEEATTKKYELKESPVNTICPKTQKGPSFFSQNFSLTNNFSFIIKELKASGLNFTDISVFWALLHMRAFPHIVNPKSKLDIYYKDSKTDLYWNINKSTTGSEYPYMQGLAMFHKKHGGKKSFAQIQKLLENYKDLKVLVTHDLENVLRLNGDLITKSEGHRKLFQRGDELLRESESMPNINWARVIGLINKKQSSKTNNELLHYLFNNNDNELFGQQDVSCNFDIKLYQNSIYPITQKENNNVVTFGLVMGEFSMIATSSFDYDFEKPPYLGKFVDGEAPARPSAMCKYTTKDNNELVFVATNSRDNGQLLYHLMRYELNTIKEPSQLDGLLRFSRHLFLTNPPRLIYESLRGKKEQLQKLLGLKFPIYHSRTIGKIDTIYKYQNKLGPIIDDRYRGSLQCQK